jgi:hypothetical protein
MLRFLTDSHVPPHIAKAAARLAAVEVIPLREWHGGLYLHEIDPKIIERAWDEGLTILTYDVNTFPLHIKARLENGMHHAGVVYVSARFRQNEIGAVARGIVRLWRQNKGADWTDRIYFLDR